MKFLIFVFFISTFAQADVITYECQIVDTNGKLLKLFPGGHCAYTPDGNVISSTQEDLKKFSPEGLLVWKKYLNSHHTLKILNDNQFLLMTSSVHPYEGVLTRFDRLSLFNMDGEEIAHFDFHEHYNDILKLAGNKKYRGDTFRSFKTPSVQLTSQQKKNFKPVYIEFSHANSIAKIQKNSISKKIEAFSEGNFLVNDTGLKFIFILSHDFKKILWSMPYSKLNYGGNIHDVQIDRSGKHILFYNNDYTSSSSAIEKYNPITGKKILIYAGSEKQPFFGLSQGGVQELEDGTFLISQLNQKLGNKIFIVDPRGNIKWQIKPTKEGLHGLPLEGLQEARQQNLDSFLKKNLK